MKDKTNIERWLEHIIMALQQDDIEKLRDALDVYVSSKIKENYNEEK